MDLNIPEVVAEVSAAFERYEKALVANDVAVLDELFWNDRRTIRYGGGENLYGYAAIQAFRAARPAINLARRLDRTEIATFGRDFATVNTLFLRDANPGKVGRQSQTWIRTREGWRVASAHVSVIDNPY